MSVLWVVDDESAPPPREGQSFGIEVVQIYSRDVVGFVKLWLGGGGREKEDREVRRFFFDSPSFISVIIDHDIMAGRSPR